MISTVVKHFSRRARLRRARIFRSAFELGAQTKILDLGSEDGANIHRLLENTGVLPENVFIADIEPSAVNAGCRRFGFVPVTIDKTNKLPFPDRFFDIVYCSSVIEHVTVPKTDVWRVTAADEFRRRALRRQADFACEVRRVGKSYFVQTPYKWFVVESHSWLPFVGWLPRPMLIAALKFTNRGWIKRTEPDWNLLDKSEFQRFFPDAEVRAEKFLRFTKSLIAIKKTFDDFV